MKNEKPLVCWEHYKELPIQKKFIITIGIIILQILLAIIILSEAGIITLEV